MIRSYCFDTEKNWDEGIHLLFFCCKGICTSLLDPFELVIGHTVHGPLKLLKEKVLSDAYFSMCLISKTDYQKRVKLLGPISNQLKAK